MSSYASDFTYMMQSEVGHGKRGVQYVLEDGLAGNGPSSQGMKPRGSRLSILY